MRKLEEAVENGGPEDGTRLNDRLSIGCLAFRNENNEFAHIDNVHEAQTVVLEEIDGKPWTWETVKILLVASVGFFVDSYDVFSVGLLTEMLGIVYGGGQLDIASDMAIKMATPVGTLCGQVLFGSLADRVGRKPVYGAECILVIVATVSMAMTGQGPGLNPLALFAFWRFVLGLGIGGDYPVCATIVSEYASKKTRGTMMNLMFAMQGVGQLFVGIVMTILTRAFRSHLEAVGGDPAMCSQDVGCVTAVDKMWRILIGLAAVPACAVLYSRLTMEETPRYKQELAAKQADRELQRQSVWSRGIWNGIKIQLESSRIAFGKFRRQPKLLQHFIGTAGSWFLLDIAFYGLNMNIPIILDAMGWSTGSNMYEKFDKTAIGNLALVGSAVPGYLVSALFIDRIGRRPIQLFGFFALTLLFSTIAGTYFKSNDDGGVGLLIQYSFCQFFFNFGPNSTTFIVPAEIFPTRYRGTLHGSSAAAGKLGAIIAQAILFGLKSQGGNSGVQVIMATFAGVMALGFLTTLLLPETKGRSLEEIDASEEKPHTPPSTSSGEALPRPLDV